MRKSVYEKQEDIPEADRSFYVARDGKWVADFDVREHPDALGLKTALDKERGGRETAEKALKPFEGVTPEVLTELRDKAGKFDAVKDKKGVDQDEIARLEKDYKQKLADAVKPHEDAAAAAKAELKGMRISSQLSKLALDSGVDPTRVTDALALNAGRFDLDEQGRIMVVDAQGRPEAMTPEKFWTEAEKAARPWLYAGTGTTGSGAQQSSRQMTNGKVLRIDSDETFHANLEGIATGKVTPAA